MSDVWLGRFRVSGTNWEGRDWFLVPGLIVLADQISQAYPAGQPGDGTVASRNHDVVSPNSDHRPTPHHEQRQALVRALDAGETTNEIGRRIVDAIVESRDPRLQYVIYERKSVWSVPHNGHPAWTWQTYLGPAPHTGHFHLSTKRTHTADNDTRPWTISPQEEPPLIPISATSPIGDIQLAQGRLGVPDTGTWTTETREAVKALAGRVTTGDQGAKDGKWINARMWNQLSREFHGGPANTPTVDLRVLGQVL